MASADTKFSQARAEIFQAHDEDPNKTTIHGQEVPYETHYSEKMESYLSKRDPNASDILRLAVAAQHFRRWEIPRQSFPMTKAGYYSWRTQQKKRHAELLGQILDKYYAEADVKRCMALVEKEGLKQADGAEEEVQVLEDVACLVFLDDQFDEFKEKHDEEKMIGILRKTWGKMSVRGHELALQIPMTPECEELVKKALGN